MFVVMLAALSNFLAGSIMGPDTEEEKAKGFVGYSGKIDNKMQSNYYLNTYFNYLRLVVDLLNENWKPAYVITDGRMQNFISVFSVYFPASIGILAGANVSGNLKVKPFAFH